MAGTTPASVPAPETKQPDVSVPQKKNQSAALPELGGQSQPIPPKVAQQDAPPPGSPSKDSTNRTPPGSPSKDAGNQSSSSSLNQVAEANSPSEIDSPGPRRPPPPVPDTDLGRFQAWCLETFGSAEKAFQFLDVRNQGSEKAQITCFEFIDRCFSVKKVNPQAELCPCDPETCEKILLSLDCDKKGFLQWANFSGQHELLEECQIGWEAVLALKEAADAAEKEAALEDDRRKLTEENLSPEKPKKGKETGKEAATVGRKLTVEGSQDLANPGGSTASRKMTPLTSSTKGSMDGEAGTSKSVSSTNLRAGISDLQDSQKSQSGATNEGQEVLKDNESPKKSKGLSKDEGRASTPEGQEHAAEGAAPGTGSMPATRSLKLVGQKKDEAQESLSPQKEAPEGSKSTVATDPWTPAELKEGPFAVRLADLDKFRTWCVSSFSSPASFMKYFDHNGNGKLSCSEFIERCGSKCKLSKIQPCPGDFQSYRRVFSHLDVHRTGIIDRRDFLLQTFVTPQEVYRQLDAQRKGTKPSPIEDAGDLDTEGPLSPLVPTPDHTWANATISKLNMSKALLKDMKMHLGAHQAAGAKSARKQMENAIDAANQLRAKITHDAELTRTLEQCIKRLEDNMRQSIQRIGALRRSQRAMAMSLNVCERRLELRDGRPLAELIRDKLQRALEDEWDVAAGASRELTRLVVNGEELMSRLDALRGQLVGDLHIRRRQLRNDKSLLQGVPGSRDFTRSMPARMRMEVSSARGPSPLTASSPTSRPVSRLDNSSSRAQTPLPQTPMSSRPGPQTPRAETPASRPGSRLDNQQPSRPVSRLDGQASSPKSTHYEDMNGSEVDMNQLLADAAALEEEAIRTHKESDIIMNSLIERCNESSKYTDNCINKRIKKVRSLKAALEKQLLETIQIIKAAQNSLAHTNKLFDLQNFCVPNASQTLAVGDLEECEGGIAEDTDIMAQDVDICNEPIDKSFLALSEKANATLDALQKLKESEAQLREDFKNKDLALRIDEMCRKVTPRNAPEVGRATPASRTITPFQPVPEHGPHPGTPSDAAKSPRDDES